MPIRPLACAILAALSAQGYATIASAAAEGELAGHVVRARDSQPVADARVQITETGAKTVTNARGAYAFEDLVPGVYTVVVTPPTGSPTQHTVNVAAGKDTTEDFALTGEAREMSALESITVLAQRTPESIARKAQQEAPNLIDIATYEQIRKLPDISTAEAVRRIPGISLETDEGEGRYVNIRGLDADLNSTTFGGLRLPPTNNASPFGGYRAVTLDSIPIGLVGAITVTKSNLPSQDAEALGGTIEITPKTAPQNGAPFIQGNVGSGYEPLRRTGIVDVSVTGGGRFGGGSGDYADKPFSVVLTATDYEDKRGIDDVEPAYFNDGVLPYGAINNIQQRDYELHRKRHGYGVDLGFQPDSNNSYYIRAFDAGYTEYYERPFLSISPDGAAVQTGGTYTDTLNGGSAIQKNLREEKETARDVVFVAGGKNLFADNTLDYRVGYTRGTYSKPWDYNSSFTYVNPSAAPAATITYSPTGPGHTPAYQIAGAPGYLDPANYQLSSFSNSSAYNFDKEASAAVNLELPVHWAGFDTESLKMGLSARLRKKRTTAQPYSYPGVPPATPLSLSTVASSGNETYYDGRYQNGVDIHPGVVQSIYGYGSIAPGDAIGALQQFLDAKENVYAAYGQYQMTRGPFGLVAGVRVERTQDRSNAYAFSTANVDAAGNEIPTTVVGETSYTNVFPGLQARYEIASDLIARATYSSTLARPGFNQVNPTLTIDLGAGIVSTGNPKLKPATANSFDVSIEKYLPGSGILSFGLFDKQIAHYIVANVVPNAVVPTAGTNLPLKLFSFTNASGSYARGAELNYEQRFRDLPGVFSGLGFGANYTFVESRFQIRPGEYAQLPSTSKNTWNVSVFYDNAGVNLRLAAYSASQDLFAIGGDVTGDVYNAKRTSMDFGSSYAFTEHWALYFNAKNLLDTPHAFYQGTSDRPIQREFYGQTYQFGLRFDY
ncbi:MAG: TonB-dependent receptor [Steroidobacteraceae bacterium]